MSLSWWNSTTREARAAQVLGGIELGMTASQIAFNCRTTRKEILRIARINGWSKRLPQDPRRVKLPRTAWKVPVFGAIDLSEFGL